MFVYLFKDITFYIYKYIYVPIKGKFGTLAEWSNALDLSSSPHRRAQVRTLQVLMVP